MRQVVQGLLQHDQPIFGKKHSSNPAAGLLRLFVSLEPGFGLQHENPVVPLGPAGPLVGHGRYHPVPKPTQSLRRNLTLLVETAECEVRNRPLERP